MVSLTSPHEMLIVLVLYVPLLTIVTASAINSIAILAPINIFLFIDFPTLRDKYNIFLYFCKGLYFLFYDYFIFVVSIILP